MKKSFASKTKMTLTGLVAVALIGSVGGVASAQPINMSWDSMWAGNHKPTSMQDMEAGKDMWMHQAGMYMQAKQDFDSQVRGSLNQAYADMGETDKQSLYTFYDSYNQAWSMLETDMAKAASQYKADMDKDMGDQARNNFEQASSKAQSDFMQRLEMAKNQLAGDMDKAGMAQSKDMFMNHFNAAKDMFGQHMEQLRGKMHDMM